MLAVLKIAKIVTGGLGSGMVSAVALTRSISSCLLHRVSRPSELCRSLGNTTHGSKGCNRATSHAVALVAQYGCGERTSFDAKSQLRGAYLRAPAVLEVGALHIQVVQKLAALWICILS